MKYSVGRQIEKYKEVKITSDEMSSCSNSKIVLYLDSESNDRLMDYYKTVRNILRDGKNDLLVLLNEDKPSNIAQAIVHLCLEYADYKIYKVYDETVIDYEYVTDMFARESSPDEVQMYVSKDGEAFETITEALLKITELCLDDKVIELQDYITENRDLFKEYPSVLDYMKQNIDELNLGMSSKVKNLEKKLELAKKDARESEIARDLAQQSNDNLETVVKQQREEQEKSEHKIKTFEQTVEKLKTERDSLEDMTKQLQSSSQVETGTKFKDYMTTKLLSYKVRKVTKVIYFKEISPPKYVNSFITYFIEHISSQYPELNIKLAIFDSREDFSSIYRPLTLVNSDDYASKQQEVLRSKKVVFTDTNPVYLNDLISKSDCKLLIIYDRLGKSKNLLTGNTVIPFYLFSSKTEMLNLGDNTNLEGFSPDRVILPSGSEIPDVLEIVEDDAIKRKQSDIAKKTLYMKMKPYAKASLTLFEAISVKCGILEK